MIERYAVTILGAGPAGLFAADRLAGRGDDLLVIDCGPEPRSRTAGVQGVGGAGLFSDGKLNLSTQIGGDPATFGRTHAEVLLVKNSGCQIAPVAANRRSDSRHPAPRSIALTDRRTIELYSADTSRRVKWTTAANAFSFPPCLSTNC